MKKINYGYFDALIYVFVSSIAFVFADQLIKDIQPMIAICLMSCVAIITFNLINIRQAKVTYKACIENKWMFIAMSLSLALDWFGMIFATNAGDPFIADAGLFIGVAIVGFIKIFLDTKNKHNLISICLLIIALIIMVTTYQIRPGHSTVFGVIYGLFAGFTFYVYIATSEKFARSSSLSSLSVLSTRFWILLLMTIPFIKFQDVLKALENHLFGITVTSLGMTVISVYFNQQAINKLGAAKTSVFIALVPPVVYICYILNGQAMTANNTCVCLIITIALFVPKLISTNKIKHL